MSAASRRAPCRVGWGGFALIIAWQLLIFVVLGIAWDVLTQRGPNRTLWVFVFGRMVRDSAANCLPFSQLGGFVFGARAVTLFGVTWPVATASTVVDVTAEFLAQLAFTALGLAILLIRVPHSALTGPLELGLGLAVAAAVAFIVVQRKGAALFARIGHRIASRRLASAREGVAALEAEMRAIYSQPLRLALCWTVHLVGWMTTGVAGWIAYRLLGVPIDLDAALAIEALLSALAALAFLVPVNAGVQEAGYAGLGAIFGIPPEISLSVSLIRRARDLVIGVPVLLIWQFIEFRRMRRGQRVETAVRRLADKGQHIVQHRRLAAEQRRDGDDHPDMPDARIQSVRHRSAGRADARGEARGVARQHRGVVGAGGQEQRRVVAIHMRDRLRRLLIVHREDRDDVGVLDRQKIVGTGKPDRARQRVLLRPRRRSAIPDRAPASPRYRRRQNGPSGTDAMGRRHKPRYARPSRRLPRHHPARSLDTSRPDTPGSPAPPSARHAARVRLRRICNRPFRRRANCRRRRTPRPGTGPGVSGR